jgi:hypothetical protein
VVLLTVIVFSVDSGGSLGFGTLVGGRCPHTKFLVVLLTPSLFDRLKAK